MLVNTAAMVHTPKIFTVRFEEMTTLKVSDSIFKTNLKQMNNKRKLFNLYKYIVLVTRLRIFCSTLFTNNNIKVVIQMHSFQFDSGGGG